MNWKILDFNDFRFLSGNIHDELFGSDSSLVNLFLLQKKYDIKTSVQDGFLFRYYTGSGNRTGYGFPIALTADGDALEDAGADTLEAARNESSLFKAFELIFSDAQEHGRKMQFCLLTAVQKECVERWLREKHPDLKADFQTNRDDCDYIYERKKLAVLAGKTYHKKKNHVSRFLRIHEGEWEFRLLSLCNISDDIISVSKQWLDQRVEKAGGQNIADMEILRLELESIKLAVANKDSFNLEGGVLYIGGKPVAMTLASRISDGVLDVHYEKCLEAAAVDGAYAAINWCFANACPDFTYLNREEDMGVEGLRKAKLSYHPDILLDKFYGEIA